MKKLYVTLAVIAVAALSATATVEAARHLPQAVNIYSVSGPERQGNAGVSTVSTFDDRGNRCYIVRTYRESTSVSCVRMNQ